MKDKKNDGKDVEKLTGKTFKTLMSRKKAVVVRLHDTKSAAYFLPPSAGDFMGVAYNRPILIECKSSEIKHSFADCSVKDYVAPTQFAYHKLWMNQGGLSIFIFHSLPMNTLEVWYGQEVLKAYSTGKKMTAEGRAVGFTEKDLIAALEKMVEKL